MKNKRNRLRNKQIKFWVTEEERLLIEEKKQLSGFKKQGAYIRKMAIDGIIYKLDNKPLRELNTKLTRTSTNINQIAKRVNSTDSIYAEDVKEIKEMMKEIWQLQKYITSKLP